MNRIFIDAPLLVYLNTLTDSDRIAYEEYYLGLVSENVLYTDVLVLDELIHVSYRKYRVPYELSIEFIESIVLPFTNILSIGLKEYELASKYIIKYNLKPSDAIHLAAMKSNGIGIIVTEDKDYDRVDVVRKTWLKQT